MAVSVFGGRATGRPNQRAVTGPGQLRQARLASCYRATLLIGTSAGFWPSPPEPGCSCPVFTAATPHSPRPRAAAACRGTDLVSLAVAVPVLAVSVLSAARGSIRAQLIWLGVLAYTAYTYLYAFHRLEPAVPGLRGAARPVGSHRCAGPDRS